MNSKTKNWIRAVVIAGVISWPGVETYRLCVTTQQMETAQALERSVQVRLAAARTKHVQMATVDSVAPSATRDSKR